MSTLDSKKTKRRRNKAKGDNSSSKLANSIHTSNQAISKIEQLMDADEDSLPLLNISLGSNPYFSSDKCLMCQREKDSRCVYPATLDESWEEFEILPYDLANSAQLPLWICNECRCDMESGNRKSSKKRSATANTDEKLFDLTTTETFCNCQTCFEKRTLKYEQNPLHLDESYSELSEFVRHVYKDDVIDWSEDKNRYELRLLDKLKHVVNSWCVNSSHELFLWLEFQVRDHVVELKMKLLTHLRRNGMSPFQAKLFMVDLLEGYARLCCASKKLRPVVQELEKDYLKKMNLSWELVNRHLFQTIIYADERIQSVLPFLIHQLNISEKDEKEQKNVTSILQKYLKLDEQMKIVAVLWAEAEPLIHGFNNSQPPSKTKQKVLNDDTESFTVQHKNEHQVVKKCEAGFHKTLCEECTLKYLLTCRLMPNTDVSLGVRTALAISSPFPPSFMSSMANNMDTGIIEATSNVASSTFSKGHVHCCGNAFDLPNGIKKVLGEENVKRLAQIMSRAVGCSGSHHSLSCKSSLSHVDSSIEREPGDGASENCNPLCTSTKTYRDDNVKGSCHVCSSVANETVDHALDSTSAIERSTFETPCECHVCVQHVDRATIPSVITSPLPAALHLYPHIHGTNIDHSVNSQLFKPVLHSQIREVYTSSVLSAKDQSKDIVADKSVTKSTMTDYLPTGGTNVDCSQSKILQASQTCSQSNECSQLLEADIDVQDTIKRPPQITTNISVKTQTQDYTKNDVTCTKCVTHNKAVQATSNISCWSSSLAGVSHYPIDHRVKHNIQNHTTSSTLENGNSGAQKNVDPFSISECRHNSTKTNIRPTAEDTKGTSVVHSCGHHNGYTHSSTTIRHSCRETRCSFMERQSLSPSRPSTDPNHLRGGDGEDLDDSCSEQSSSTSASNTKDHKHCDCCYCEVFGHDVVSMPSTSRNYPEMREKLRQRLNRKKMECKIVEPEPCNSRKVPQEDCRDLDSLISFINGNKDVGSGSTNLDNSPKKLFKFVKKPNKKLKKVDLRTDSRIIDGEEDSVNVPNEDVHNHLDSCTCESNAREIRKASHHCNVDKTSLKLDITNVKMPVIEKSKDRKNMDFNTDSDCHSKCTRGVNDASISSAERIEVSALSEKINGTSNVERNDKRKKCQVINILPSDIEPWIMEPKAKIEKQCNVSNTKLKRHLSCHNKIEIAIRNPELKWNVTKSPFPVANSGQDYSNHFDKSEAVQHSNDTIERESSVTSLRKCKNAREMTKHDPVFLTECLSTSKSLVLNDGLLHKINGIQSSPSSILHSSPSHSNQSSCKGRKIKKKPFSSDLPSAIDEVFLPRDIDLENGELDEMERELEAFKRFCLNSVPVPNKEKIRVNLKDFNLRKKTAVECN